MWQDTLNPEANIRQKPGKGTGKVVILHIGSQNGFVEDGADVFICQKGHEDYHESMSSQRFQSWLKRILPKLTPNSVIVVDNASYHNAKPANAPNSKWNRDDLLQWLWERGFVADDEGNLIEFLYVRDLKKLCQQKLKLEPMYRSDDMIREAGHIPLRLPVYHCKYSQNLKYGVIWVGS